MIEEINQRISFIIFQLRVGRLNPAFLWIFDPIFYFMPKLSHAISLYDCVDYHPGFHGDKTQKDIQRMEKILMRQVDYYFVNSHSLYALHKNERKPNAIVPQGFRFEEFRKTKTVRKRLFDKPTIGYVGALDDRLDTPTLQELIRRNPQWQFVLWGSTKQDFLDGREHIHQKIDSILHEGNVATGKSNNPDEIASVIQQFDVGIIPYDNSLSSVRYSYPMKLFEYFYFGKPVASTPIEELKRFPKFVKFGVSVEEWESNIRLLLAKRWPETYRREQRRLAVDNSWEEKIIKILSVVGNHEKHQYI
jgi:glycosyltransferase involved in cell wall biosynthesis